MGMDDSGVAEMGPVVVSFQFDRASTWEAIPTSLSGTAEFDARLGCTTLTDTFDRSDVAQRQIHRCRCPPPQHGGHGGGVLERLFSDRGFLSTDLRGAHGL